MCAGKRLCDATLAVMSRLLRLCRCPCVAASRRALWPVRCCWGTRPSGAVTACMVCGQHLLLYRVRHRSIEGWGRGCQHGYHRRSPVIIRHRLDYLFDRRAPCLDGRHHGHACSPAWLESRTPQREGNHADDGTYVRGNASAVRRRQHARGALAGPADRCPLLAGSSGGR